MAIVLGALPTRAEAQALYYRSIPIGDHAVGLGGAFTGVATDSSAAYYNPAGLVRGGRFELQGSFASIVFTKYKIENAFDSPQRDETFDSTGTSALPRFVGTAVKVGPKKFGDDHQFAVGYSTVEVARNRLNIGTAQNDPTFSLDLRVDNNYRSRWYGVSFAAEVTKKSAVGFTIFLSDQAFGYGEDIGIALGGTFDEQTGLRVGGDSVTASSSIGVRAYHFVPRLGWLHQINSQWAIGMMVQTPGIPLKQKGDVLRRITTDISPDEPTFFLFDSGSIKAKMPIPFELRAGFGFQINEETLLSFDAAVTGPVKDGTLFGRPAELENIDVRSGVYFSSSIARRWTPNLSIGAEHKFGKAVVAGGLFTNFSAAPDVPETSQEYTPDQVNMWGASVAIGVDTKGYRFTVGATGLFGKGDALAAVLDENTDVVSYRRTQATRAAIILYISGAISVATKGAKQVQEKQKERKRKRKNGDTGAGAGTDAGTDADADTGPGADTDTGTDTDTATDN
ncbi:MAG: hypothetical protein OEQ49_05415 [Myxococcales bacterium]|nr:hypothetical protein [Myxococcales bacterium]